MNDNKKNLIDSFIEKYDEYNSKKKVKVETYYRPSKAKSIFGFVFCLIFFLILLRIFHFSVIYLVIFIGDLVCLLYFGLNLFTKNGFVVKQKFSVPEEYLMEDEEQEENNDEENEEE